MSAQRSHNKNIKLIIMRAELNDEEKEFAISEFLDLPDFSIVRSNIGSKKKYASTYNLFKETFIHPDWYIDKMYNSRFFNHFYSIETKKKLIAKWKQQE